MDDAQCTTFHGPHHCVQAVAVAAARSRCPGAPCVEQNRCRCATRVPPAVCPGAPRQVCWPGLFQSPHSDGVFVLVKTTIARMWSLDRYYNPAQADKIAEARAAFDALNGTKELLRDPGALVSTGPWLMVFPPSSWDSYSYRVCDRIAQRLFMQEQVLASAARARWHKRQAEASLEERRKLNAQRKEAAWELNQDEVGFCCSKPSFEAFNQSLSECMHARVMHAGEVVQGKCNARCCSPSRSHPVRRLRPSCLVSKIGDSSLVER